MFSDKLISLLQTLSRVEMTRLYKFLRSPYFNEEADIVRLFELVNQAIRKGGTAMEQLSKEKVWTTLYPGQPLNDAHLRRLSSDLTQLVLQFLVQEARRQDPLEEALELQKALEKPELKKHLAGAERHIQKLLDDSSSASTTAYLGQFRRYWNIFYRASKVVATADYADKLRPADFYLECFYLTQKLKFYIAWLSYRGFRATEQVMPIIPGFWEYIKDRRFQEIPLLRIYQLVIACFTEPEEETHFYNLINELDQFAPLLIKEDLRECYHIAQNYCALKINQGKPAYYREMFNIFKKIIEKGMLIEGENLSEGVYKNIITSSLGVNEFTWAEEFIQAYSTYLPAPIRENARSFNLAYLYFHLKSYKKVIDLLQNVEYSDVTYALGAKSILLRTFYETNEIIALDSSIESFRIFLRRNKVISKNQKREYNNFLNIVKKLTSVSPGDQAALTKLRQRVTETASMMPKKWVLEKIEELQRKHAHPSLRKGAEEGGTR